MKKLTLEQKLFLNGFRPDAESHLRNQEKHEGEYGNLPKREK